MLCMCLRILCVHVCFSSLGGDPELRSITRGGGSRGESYSEWLWFNAEGGGGFVNRLLMYVRFRILVWWTVLIGL